MNIQEDVSLGELTTLKVGGRARYFAVITTSDELQEAIIFAKGKKVPLVVLGGGSNVLIANGEINALVAKIEIRGVTWEDRESSFLVIAGAGESWDGLVLQAVSKGLWGIENLSGIPGTVGAAPIQNIGAYGTEVKDIIEWVEVFDTKTGEAKRLSREDCKFGYRDSVFKHSKGKEFIVTRVAFRLRKNGTPNVEYKDLTSRISNSKFLISNLTGEKKDEKEIAPRDIRRAVLEIRSGKFPDLKEFGTAGSFFKNPIIPEAQFSELKKKFPNLPGFPLPSTVYGLPSVKVPLAWILEHLCGLKGFEKGNVKLFQKQPIVLVHNGCAAAEEIEVFANEVVEKVKAKTGIEIEWEVQRIM